MEEPSPQIYDFFPPHRKGNPKKEKRQRQGRNGKPDGANLSNWWGEVGERQEEEGTGNGNKCL